MNNFICTGNIGRDSERKTLPTTTLIEFSMAFQSGFGDNKKSVWIKCKIWGKRAENDNLLNELRKGTKVLVSGELGEDEWGEGKKMMTLNVTGWPEIFPPKGSGGKQESSQPAQSQQSDEFDDDLPF